MTREQIANILERLIPEGKDNAIHGHTLRPLLLADLWMAEESNYCRLADYPGPTAREMRDIIADLIPWTCSCSKGYYKAATTDERRQAVAYIESYIRSLARRRRAIISRYSADFCGVQLNLEV
jgi:hypothetical protein